jgi:hypothetical protein
MSQRQAAIHMLKNQEKPSCKVVRPLERPDFGAYYDRAGRPFFSSRSTDI